MNDVIEIENSVNTDGVRTIHLMSNDEINVDDLENSAWFIPDGIDFKITKEAGAFHLRATWRARQAFAGVMRGGELYEKKIALWPLEIGDHISAGIHEAVVIFRKAFKRNPNFAAVRAFPKEVDVFCEIEIGGGRSVTFVESADVPDRFVMVF